MITPKEKNNEILIVGQGIAGTLLAYFLLKKNSLFKVVDMPLPGASSVIAAGIINPITGRRLVKSWRFDELSTFAQNTYHDIGQFLGISIYQEKNILHALPNIFKENEWERRSGYPENGSFFCKTADLGNYETIIKPPHAWGEITGSGKVDMPQLISYFRKYLLEKNLLWEEVFDFGKLKPFSNEAIYRGENFYKVIFCEGAKAKRNPFFNFLPFATTKGESLLVRIKGLTAGKMFKNKIYLVPLQDDIFWVGSSNSFGYQGVEPTSGMYDYLFNSLKEALAVPFEILSHKAGIRPTIADKRPLLGLHPIYSSLGIFNGLGTKGASLGPLFANQMASLIVDKTAPDAEVDIRRFEKATISK